MVGAALGTLAGMAVTPSQKQRLRRWVKQSVQRSATQVPGWMDQASRVAQTQGDRLLGAAQQHWGGTLERLRDAVAAGVAASRSDVTVAESDAAQSAAVAPEAHASERSPTVPIRRDRPSNVPPGSTTPYPDVQGKMSQQGHTSGQDHPPPLPQRRRNAYGRLQSAATTAPDASPPSRANQP